ncbi:hypothetical protein C6T61_22445 [Burkholderia multivorans]|nr:hypothetical protein C6T61_22445 [Burkholderia multivorans]
MRKCIGGAAVVGCTQEDDMWLKQSKFLVEYRFDLAILSGMFFEMMREVRFARIAINNAVDICGRQSMWLSKNIEIVRPIWQ